MHLISMWKRIDLKLIRRTVTDWLRVLVLLLDEAAALVLVILILRFLEIRIPLPITIVIGLMAGTLVFMIHKAIIPSFHKKVVTGSEGMIGAQGRVLKSLTPVGAITIRGESWKAKSVDDDIEVGEDVEIMGVDRLTLMVKRKRLGQ